MFKEQVKLLLPQENYKCFALFYTLDQIFHSTQIYETIPSPQKLHLVVFTKLRKLYQEGRVQKEYC